MADTNKILVGKIVAPQGLRGEVRVQTFTQSPMDFRNLSVFGNGIQVGDLKFVRLLNPTSSVVIAKVAGANDRNAAEALRGTELFINRESLPDLKDGEYYQADLIGMQVVCDGNLLGVVDNIQNYGAGDILELDNGELVSFIGAEVDLNNKVIYKK